MNRNKKYVQMITVIYVVIILVTLFSFLGLGFSDSWIRYIISLSAVLLAESVIYGYCIFWLYTSDSVQRTSPVLLSGALITGGYATIVFISVLALDWLLELPPLWYAAEQGLVLLLGAFALVMIGFYGWNAGTKEQEVKNSVESFRKYQSEMTEISRLAGSWNHPEADQLVKVIRLLHDEFKFSDPVTEPSLYAVEDMIEQQLSLLHDQVELLLAVQAPSESWQVEINEIADSIRATLQRRNRELAALK